MAATSLSNMATIARPMQAPAMAPGEEGVQASNRRLSPPEKCKYGVIIPLPIFMPPEEELIEESMSKRVGESAGTQTAAACNATGT